VCSGEGWAFHPFAVQSACVDTWRSWTAGVKQLLLCLCFVIFAVWTLIGGSQLANKQRALPVANSRDGKPFC
jgi:hypothetical protein